MRPKIGERVFTVDGDGDGDGDGGDGDGDGDSYDDDLHSGRS